jgi:hypothetical protein
MWHVEGVVMVFSAVVVLLASPSKAAGSSGKPDWPADWITAWSNPPADLRPLQIVHGVPPSQATAATMAALKEAGLGGIVCNVAFADYLVSEPHWATLVRAVEACRQTGLIVWIYDEEGYPSGSAGGLVLKTNPSFENTVLVNDPSRTDPLYLRRAYEHTHASNNFYAARRYPNLIDDAAMRCFVEKTHEAYWRRLEPQFGTTIRAFFTDEPSLMAVNLGQLGEQVRKHVKVVDPVDEKGVRPLPAVPWCDDLPDRYRERYGEDLMPLRGSLFVGNSETDRGVRRRFWALIADLIAERYFGRIQAWCHAHHVASSGHNLWEEEVLHHVPLYGNGLKALMRMDIPGLDVLSSDPAMVLYGGWMTATLPASAALFNGGRRVMTEVSDFSQVHGGKGPASLAEMQATAAWQAALGVTEFTSYYGSIGRIVTAVSAPNELPRNPKSLAYCDFIGRLNTLLRDARPDPDVLLYYPIHDLWAEYLPVAEPLRPESQSQRAQQIIRSFRQLGQRLLTAQASFALVDHELLGAAEARNGGIWIKGRLFDAVVFPAGVELPEPAAAVVNGFRNAGGCVLRDGDPALPVEAAVNRLAKIRRTGHLQPPCDHVVAGRFTRDRREILMFVNVGGKPYEGRVAVEPKSGPWWRADPAGGLTSVCKASDAGEITISLPVHATTLLIGPAQRTANSTP